MDKIKQCDCNSRVGTKIDSWKKFEEIDSYFKEKEKEKIFVEIPVAKPYYIGKGKREIIEWYADKWYKCNYCGTLWEFVYPDFPANGMVRKFSDGKYFRDE